MRDLIDMARKVEGMPRHASTHAAGVVITRDPVSTYVPFRNGLFLASAASMALSNGCEVIYYGAHSDDAAGNAIRIAAMPLMKQ